MSIRFFVSHSWSRVQRHIEWGVRHKDMQEGTCLLWGRLSACGGPSVRPRARRPERPPQAESLPHQVFSRLSVFGMIALSACAAAQDLSNYRIERMAEGLTYAEGPAWSRDGYLVFSDIPNNEIWRWVPGQKRELMRANSNGAIGNAFDCARAIVHLRIAHAPRGSHGEERPHRGAGRQV